MSLDLDARFDELEEARRTSVSWLQSHLPPGFSVVSARISIDWPVDPRERELVGKSVPARQADFVTGRWCAHRALEAISREQPVLEIGRLGAPAWPPGVIGSISHDDSMCIAIAGPDRNLSGIGIDLFGLSRGSVLQALAPLVLSESERRLLIGSPDQPSYVQTLFCIKEAVIKAVSLTARQFLDPRDISVRLQDNRFDARVDGLPDASVGWHCQRGPYLLALALHTETRRYATDSSPS